MVRSNGVLTIVYFYQLEKTRELPHFIFLLLSLMLHDSKLTLKLYYLRVPTSLLTGCDTTVALDSRLSLGAWKQTLTTVNRTIQSGNGRNLVIEISLTKSSNMGSPFTVQYYRPTLANTRQSWILDPIPWIQDSGCWIPVFSGGISFPSRVLELYSGFQSPGFRISYQNFPGFRILQAKIFQFPESGYPYVGRSTRQAFSDLFTHI